MDEIGARRERIRRGMEAAGLDLLIGFHDGTHFIEKPDPVTILSGFKSMGDAAVLLKKDGEATLLLSPAWDAERAAGEAPGVRVEGVESVPAKLAELASSFKSARIGLAGLSELGHAFGERMRALFGPGNADSLVFAEARRKTQAELAHARKAVEIAEAAYEELLRIAKVGMREDDLAAELRAYTKSLGADDNFLLLCAGQHNRGVQPSCGRKLEKGDIILAEITPSYKSQLAQICRTVSVGEPSKMLDEKYKLVVRAMEAGIAEAKPGNPMSEVCRAINAVLEAEGYGEYCFPPYIRRRGHGLGFASVLPGNVALDNPIILEPDMFFVIHPNQYLPETGYLLCGEPTAITARGPEPLTKKRAALGRIDA